MKTCLKEKESANEEIEDLEYDLNVKRQRLQKLMQKPVGMMKRKARRNFFLGNYRFGLKRVKTRANTEWTGGLKEQYTKY